MHGGRREGEALQYGYPDRSLQREPSVQRSAASGCEGEGERGDGEAAVPGHRYRRVWPVPLLF